jgi:hypothetical protein
MEGARVAMHEATEVARTLEAHGLLPELLIRRARLLTGPELLTQRCDLLMQAQALARAQRADALTAAAAEALRAV